MQQVGPPCFVELTGMSASGRETTLFLQMLQELSQWSNGRPFDVCLRLGILVKIRACTFTQNGGRLRSPPTTITINLFLLIDETWLHFVKSPFALGRLPRKSTDAVVVNISGEIGDADVRRLREYTRLSCRSTFSRTFTGPGFWDGTTLSPRLISGRAPGCTRRTQDRSH